MNLSTIQLINYTLHLADSNLIFAQRSAEWCGHGPVLEQDIAITNISLDCLGQARNYYQYAAELINSMPGHTLAPATEDSLAYMRGEREYKNLLLAELPNGDWAQTIIKIFFFSAWQSLMLEQLVQGADQQLAAIAAKSQKEVAYHLRWSSEWVIRLGDGTDESHRRVQEAISETWPYTGEMFIPADYEKESGLTADMASLRDAWLLEVQDIFTEATLPMPDAKAFMHTGGKNGLHTENLGFILSELQYLQRAYPNANW